MAGRVKQIKWDLARFIKPQEQDQSEGRTEKGMDSRN